MEDSVMKHHVHQEHDEDAMRSHQEAHAGHGEVHGLVVAGRGDDEVRHRHLVVLVHPVVVNQRTPRRFWISLVLSIPVLVFSPTLQDWLGYTIPDFPGSEWITPVLAVIVFLYGGIPFLQMAVPEIRNRKPGMMTLISLAISVAFVYSLAALFLPGQTGFFWELVTLIDIMLLGHWMEMRSVRQASGALDALAKLMPDTAEVILPDGNVMEHSVSSLKTGDLVLIRPGANAPADGVVIFSSRKHKGSICREHCWV